MRKIKEIRDDIREMEAGRNKLKKDIKVFKLLKTLVYLVVGAVMIWSMWHVAVWSIYGNVNMTQTSTRLMIALCVLSCIIFTIVPTLLSKEIRRLRKDYYVFHNAISRLQTELLVSVKIRTEEETP